MGHDVFISYARGASQAAARRLRVDLEQSGLTVFLDERDIPFGAAFPAELTRGLLDARAVVVFAEESYFRRPWCVHELRLITAAWRAGDAAALMSVVVALPVGTALEPVTAQLPPPLASASWPRAEQAEALAQTVAAAARASTATLRERLDGVSDDTARVMLQGADQPLAWNTSSDPPAQVAQPTPPLWWADDAPSTRGDAFIGRASALWELLHECATARAFTPARRVLLQGLGGCGKSLLAAEFVARHGRRFFPAGVVWINTAIGPEGLLQTWALLWRRLAPGAPDPDDGSADTRTRLRQIGAALDERLCATVPAGALLWVIDGLPEAGSAVAGGTSGGTGGGAIADWCPSPRQVTVLATSRRGDSLREIDAVVRLGPLGDAAALTLLTRPPVDPQWMLEANWQAVVRWVGALPLVLAVLRESLLDGSLSVEALKRAPDAEPAAESERLMEGLRGEVDDNSLRGASEAFELSWATLAAEPALADAARRLALLAPVALTEPVLDAVAGAVNVGKLVRRGWLQAGGSAGARAFTLHRVPASVLRMKIQPADACFDGLFDALSRCLVLPDADWRRARVELHTHVVTRRYYQLTPPVSSASLDAAGRFAMVAAGLPYDERRGLRYLAAVLADAVGAGDGFVAAMRAGLDPGDEPAVAAVPHVLQALPDCEPALRWMVEMLSDRRHLVRWQAVVHAPPVAALLKPVLHALLAEPAVGDDDPMGQHSTHVASFDHFLQRTELLRTALSLVLMAQGEGTAVVRRRTAQILGRALQAQGRSFVAGGYSGCGVIRHLLHMAFTDGDGAVREAAAGAAAQGGDAIDAVAWPALCDAVTGSAGAAQVWALQAVGHFLAAASLPPPPKAIRVERDDEGRVTLSGELFPTASKWPPEVVPQIIVWVLTLDPPMALEAARVLGAQQQGLAHTAPWVHARLDAQDFAAVLRLADALCTVRPDFVNAPWWRAQASAGLGDDVAASVDLETVIRLAPAFDDAKAMLVQCLQRRGRAACAAQLWDQGAQLLGRAVELLPDDPDSHHVRSICLLNGGFADGAEAAASRVIELAPGHAQAWYVRALARTRLGQLAAARLDALQAAQLDPDDSGIAQCRDELQTWWTAEGHAADP